MVSQVYFECRELRKYGVLLKEIGAHGAAGRMKKTNSVSDSSEVMLLMMIAFSASLLVARVADGELWYRRSMHIGRSPAVSVGGGTITSM